MRAPVSGRLTFRELFKYPDIFSVELVNDIAPVESAAYLAQFDSVHGVLASSGLLVPPHLVCFSAS